MDQMIDTNNRSIESFDFSPKTRIVFGQGSIDKLGEVTANLLQSIRSDSGRVLVVSDPGVCQAGHTQKGIDSLQKAGLNVCLFDGAKENPTTDDVAAGLEVAKEFRPDLLVGLGGGSSMDCAKGINFLYSCGGKMQDYWGRDKATGPMLPLVTVPTTAGTGSEMQSFALISDAESHVKMACGDKRTASKVAILDPNLTLTQPNQVTALTAIDALSHAVETFVTKDRNPISMMYSREAFRQLSAGIQNVFDDPSNLQARSQMQLGACCSGLAIENSMLGSAHALANPLTANFDTAHGQAVGMMLPHVIRFNAVEIEDCYRSLAHEFQGDLSLQGDELASEFLARWIVSILEKADLATKLDQLGIRLNDQPVDSNTLGKQAAKQWTGTFNPRPMTEMDFANLYQLAQ